jgi:tetratricopeptide (TPR) repeat protein
LITRGEFHDLETTHISDQPIEPVNEKTKKQANQLCEEGNANFARGKFRLALKAYNSSLTIEPLNIRALSNRGATHMKLGDWEAALLDVNEVLVVEPDHVKCRYRKLVILLALHQVEEAQNLLKSLQQQDPHTFPKEEMVKIQREIQTVLAEKQGIYNI